MANNKLFIAIVWLSTAVSLSCPCFAQAAATPMWSDCSSIGTNFIASPGGGDFEAVGCLFPSNITNVSLSSISSGSSASVLISDGIVTPSAQSGIWVVCPAALTSSPQGPLNITVARMAFGQDASFRFTGALPPGSSLVVASNSFYLTKINIFSTWYPNIIPAILIGATTETLSLTSGTTLSVANNTMKAIAVLSAANNAFALVFILCPVLNINGSSTLAVDGNSVENSNVGTAYAAFLGIYAASSADIVRPVLNINGSSTVAVNNIYSALYSGDSLQLPSTLPQCIYSTSSAVAAVQQGSTLTIKRNSVVQSTISRVYAAYLHINSENGAVMLFTNRSLLDLSDNAVGNVTSNQIFASRFHVNCGAGMLKFLVSNQSKIKMNGNRLWNCWVYGDACSAWLSLKSLDATMLFDGQSSIDVSLNTITNSNFESVDVAFVSFYTRTSTINLALSNGSNITIGSKGLSNSTL